MTRVLHGKEKLGRDCGMEMVGKMENAEMSLSQDDLAREETVANDSGGTAVGESTMNGWNDGCNRQTTKESMSTKRKVVASDTGSCIPANADETTTTLSQSSSQGMESVSINDPRKRMKWEGAAIDLDTNIHLTHISDGAFSGTWEQLVGRTVKH